MRARGERNERINPNRPFAIINRDILLIRGTCTPAVHLTFKRALLRVRRDGRPVSSGARAPAARRRLRDVCERDAYVALTLDIYLTYDDSDLFPSHRLIRC